MNGIKMIAFAFVVLSIASHAKESVVDSTSQWDFDHRVQFKQKHLGENRYHLEVIRNEDVNFERLATFLIRRSFDICNHYGFKLEILTGVESFTDRKAHPNKIFGSLGANLECPIKGKE